jgi:hypothetical protein
MEAIGPGRRGECRAKAHRAPGYRQSGPCRSRECASSWERGAKTRVAITPKGQA